MAQYVGTTPKHFFEVDIDLRTAEVIFLTYKQGEGCKQCTILEKTKDDMVIEEALVKTQLTQEETLKFIPDLKVEMQFRARFPSGQTVASNKMFTNYESILKGGVI